MASIVFNRRSAVLAIAAIAASCAASLAADENVLEEAKAMLAGADRDPPAIERARDRLEAAVRETGLERADPALLVQLAHVWYLVGELRVPDSEKPEAFERGRRVGEEAVRRAPRDAEAHLWYAINLGRWAEERGVMRSMLEIATVKREVAETLRLAPDHPDALVYAGAIAARLPRFLGRDRKKAEEYFRRAIALDPHRTTFRLELAELLIETGRLDEARREIAAALAETAPSDPIMNALRSRERGQRLLADLDASR